MNRDIVEASKRVKPLSPSLINLLRATAKPEHSLGEILEIIQLCGFYRTVAYFANGLDPPLEPSAARFPKP